MKRAFGIVALLAAVIALAGGVFLFAARAGWLVPDDATLRQRYAVPGARLVAIDGAPVHYVDEGRGPAIVLLHGSYSSLRSWSPWAAALKGRYRVIRFDQPPMGLSGPDPAGLYDVARQIQVIDTLTRRLGVDRFILVATSSAGLAGAGFAAEHPDRIAGLILNNIAVGPVAMDRSARSPAFKRILAIDRWFGGWHFQEYWRQILLNNFIDKAKVTPELVREWTDLNARAQRMPPGPGSLPIRASLGRTAADLPRIAAPALVLWSANDHEMPVDTVGRKALALLGSTDKRLAVIPHCGHMMPLECPVEALALALPFLDRVSRR